MGGSKEYSLCFWLYEEELSTYAFVAEITHGCFVEREINYNWGENYQVVSFLIIIDIYTTVTLNTLKYERGI